MNLCDNELNPELCTPKCCREQAKRIEVEAREKCLADIISWTYHVNSQWDFLQCIEYLKKKWGIV